MKTMMISTRLTMLIATFLVLLFCVGGLGHYGNGRSNDAIHKIYEDQLVPTGFLSDASYLLLRDRMLVMDMMIVPTPQNVQTRNTEVRAILEKFKKSWASYMSTNMDPRELPIANNVAKMVQIYVDEGLLPLADAALAGNMEQEKKIYDSKIKGNAKLIQTELDKLMALQRLEAKESYDAATARHTLLNQAFAVILVISALFGLVAGTGFTRFLKRQLGGEPREATAVARRVAEGDLRPVAVSDSAHSESILAQLRTMQSELTHVVGAVRQGAESVAVSTHQMAQGNHDLSKRTDLQAEALRKTAGSMEQLGNNVRHNADSARKANHLAQSASDVAVRGGKVVADVVDTMKGINDASRRIAEIISVIDGIAFQTNILALNAAVEAARAGEQGRGFAVVASEVRSLAGRSAEAAKEIKGLIDASVSRVEHGTALVDQAGTTMTEVVDSIRRVTDLMGEISTASTQQDQGVTEISKSVLQLDQATQENAALVEEMSAAAGSLSAQARDLVHSVGVFKLAS